MIPKVIHYCWFGGNPLPYEVKKCIKSWEKMCPDYEIKQWNESNFDISDNTFARVAYENKAWAFVSDYARLKIVFDYGGIYLDTDVELLKSLDHLLDNKCYIGIQQAQSLCQTGLGFGAEKNSYIVEKMLEKYSNIEYDVNKKLELACPILNSEAISSIGTWNIDNVNYWDEITIYPSKYFDPYGGKNLLCKDTISIHHYSASWTSGRQRFKRRLARLIGTGNVTNIKSKLKNLSN